jgi:hypothetical protein
MKQLLIRSGKISVALLLTLLVASTALRAQSITMGSIPGTKFCPGDPISVSFTVTGYFQHRNAFTLQLSNDSGRFDKNFQNLGSIQDTLPGTFTIIGRIPDVNFGSNFRFRILSALPYLASADNGSAISIGSLPEGPHFSTSTASDSIGVGNIVEFYSPGQDSDFWDFGPTATPATAKGNRVKTSFLTGGHKIVVLRTLALGGCARFDTTSVNVVACAVPAIPQDAIVVAHDTSISYPPRTLWVNPGVRLSVGHTILIFAETGSNISSGGGGGIIYLKRGAQYSGGRILVIHDSATSYTNGGNDLLCNPLDFDYTNAPPNVAFHNGVFTEANESLIQLSPNPAHDLVNISGLPKEIVSATLVNVLGATVREIANPHASTMKLDLGDLQTGMYFLRIATANSVITKKIVRE